MNGLLYIRHDIIFKNIFLIHHTLLSLVWLYVDDNTFSWLKYSYLGMKIGNVNCNASACADDVALMSIREHETQVMINIAHEFATMVLPWNPPPNRP
jgi:hypothetical protein